MEKITKKEFLKRFDEAKVAGIVLDNNRKSLNLRNIEEIKLGDYYIKDGREHVVINVDDNIVEINQLKMEEKKKEIAQRLKNLTTPEGQWNKLSEDEKKELNEYVLSLSDDSDKRKAWVLGWRGYGLGGI